MKIYVPNLNYECYVVLDKDTIRSYENEPLENTDINYTDYFVNSHYLEKKGIETITTIPICIDKNNLTDSWYYRNDISDILIIITIFCLFCFYLPIKIFLRLFKRFQ